MHITKFKNKLESIKEYITALKPMREKCKRFLGITAKTPHGEYKNRWGKITDAFINDDGEILVLIRPFRLKGNKKELGEFLWERVDARTFWKLSDVKEVKDLR